jgi:short-subunit dehydrogenase
MRVNYFGAVALTKALLPSMIARHGGHFVVVSSLVGIIGSPMRSGYSASKHALHGFFDSLRAEHHDDGIRVTIVCPGFVRTDVSVHALTGHGAPQGTMDAATARGIEPDVCAQRIVRGVEHGERELYVGGRETVAVYLKRYWPAAFERMLRRARVV